MAAKSGVILSAQKLDYAEYLSKKRIKPFPTCPHLVRYSILYWLSYNDIKGIGKW